MTTVSKQNPRVAKRERGVGVCTKYFVRTTKHDHDCPSATSLLSWRVQVCKAAASPSRKLAWILDPPPPTLSSWLRQRLASG